MTRMKEDKNWFYWNNLPNLIPEDVSQLTDRKKDEYLEE